MSNNRGNTAEPTPLCIYEKAVKCLREADAMNCKEVSNKYVVFQKIFHYHNIYIL